MNESNKKLVIEVCEGQPVLTGLILNRIENWEKLCLKNDEYTPFIKVKRFSTSGKGSKVYNEYSSSTHEALSILEQQLLRALDFMPNIIEIQMQYPLLPVRETILIADSLGIRHPSFKPKGRHISPEYKIDQAIAMTSDYVIFYRDINGEVKTCAIALKAVNERGDYSDKAKRAENICDKLSIEGEYWERDEKDWEVFTSEKEYFEPDFARNLEEAETRKDFPIDDELLMRVQDCVESWFINAPRATFDKIKEQVAKQLDQRSGVIRCAIWKLIWQQKLDVDITKPIVFNRPLPQGGKKWLWH